MAKKVKTKYFGTRVDETTDQLVAEYVALADEIESVGDLVRKALLEYMANHPVVKQGQSQ